MRNISTIDRIQIILNLTAFSFLVSAITGQGSFWGFATFFLLSGEILLEILLSKDRTALWIWIVKTATYFILVVKFSSNIGPFHWQYLLMIGVSLMTLIASRKLIKSRAIAMWGTNVAYVIGGAMYIIAIINKPGDYGIHHIIFWLVNWLSYSILIWQIVREKRDRVNLIIPVYAFVFCLVYVVVILIT